MAADTSATLPTFRVLDGENYLSLTTFRRNGVGVATPVWFAKDGETLYIYTGTAAGKVKRLRHQPRVTVAPCTMRGVITGPTLIGTARLLDDPTEIARAKGAIRRRYGLQYRLLSFVSRLSGLFDRRPKSGTTYIAITPTVE
jgi:uncharacterized protein